MIEMTKLFALIASLLHLSSIFAQEEYPIEEPFCPFNITPTYGWNIPNYMGLPTSTSEALKPTWMTLNLNYLERIGLCSLEADILVKCDVFNQTKRQVAEKWPLRKVRPVYYAFSKDDFASAVATGIVEVMDYFTRVTQRGIVFIRTCPSKLVNANAPTILFKKSKGYCAIMDREGYKGDVIHEIFMHRHCLYKPQVAHLVMHVLGFTHEVNHPNRDNYIHIFRVNLDKEDWRHFEKHPSSTKSLLRFPFDPKSVMMYDQNDFQVNPLFPVIIPLSQSINPFDFQRVYKDGWYANFVDRIFSYTDLTKLRDTYAN